jgi:trigger factor
MDGAKVTLEDLSPVRKRLQVEVPAQVVQAELDRAYQQLTHRARLPGFRPGRAPRHVLERMFGPQVRREVLARLVEESFHEAIEARGLALVGHPEIDTDEGIRPGDPLRYAVNVEVRPEIRLADLGGIEVTRPTATVTDEDVARTLEALRESVAQLRPLDDRAVVEAGDIVSVDLTSRLDDGEPTRRQDVLLEAGSGAFPLALERQIVGQHRGARLSLQVPYPADYENSGLAGRKVDFEVEIKDLRTKELPALDDDFARDHGRCETLAELRRRIRADLEQQAGARADDAVRAAVLEQALARHEFETPPSLVARRTEALLAGLGVRVPQGGEHDHALDEIRGQLRPRAERLVRAELLLDAMAAHERVEVSDEEVAVAIDAIAAREREVVERVRGLYAKPEARESLRAKVRRDRVLAGLVARARVVPASPGESVADEK